MPVINRCKLCKEKEAREEDYGLPYCHKCIPLIDYIKRTEYEIQNEINKISKGRVYIQIKLMEEQIDTISDPYYDDVERFNGLTEEQMDELEGHEKEEKLRRENPEIC